MAKLRTPKILEKRNQRLQTNKLKYRQLCQYVIDASRQLNWQHIQIQRTLMRWSFNRLILKYDSKIEYSPYSKIIFSEMDKECQY